MGKPAVSLRNKLIALCAAGLLACGLLPFASAFADGAQGEPVGAGFVPAQSEGSAVGATPNSILASTLTSDGISIISTDVALDNAAPEPVIGSFTVDGLTFSVNSEGGATLVSVDPSVILSEGGAAPGVEGSLTDESEDSSTSLRMTDSSIAIPSSITYNGVAYPVIAIGAFAFYLSGATQVELPASITLVDDRAFRSSDVEAVTVDGGNPNIASFDGALCSADKSRLQLIPEGTEGSVLLSCETEVVEASKFSHCSLVDAISVEEGGAAFSSWERLLYNASGTTLLRVPAGATEITIREGCTTIAAGAMEGCAKLERINAPSTVISINPNVFESVPTVALPSSVILSDDAEVSTDVILSVGSEAAEVEGSPSQLTAMVALSSADGGILEANPSSIQVMLLEGADASPWEASGMSIVAADVPVASAQSAATSNAILKYGISGNDSSTQFTSSNSANYQVGQVATNVGFTVSADQCTLVLKSDGTFSTTQPNATIAGKVLSNYGLRFKGWTTDLSAGAQFAAKTITVSEAQNSYYVAPVWYDQFTAYLDDGLGTASREVSVTFRKALPAVDVPTRAGYKLLGYRDYEGKQYYDGNGIGAVDWWDVAHNQTLYAEWEPIQYDIGFDVDSEPGDEAYPGDAKPDETVNVVDGQVEIENPTRPGYVFQGWVIPDAETGNKEALDQDLVYQGDDGKWYVDASKLPDYETDGKVELTARWTSVISVDVPNTVIFYADTTTKGQESREGAASSAFGQSQVSNQSKVDLRVVGLESEAVETTDAMLGADSILKKAAAATPATSAQKLLSLYPNAKAWTAEELQDPDAVGGTKAATAVDFDLDDLLLEASFAADDFTIPAGDTLNMGYRLNLTETGQELDYDKLATLEDGQSASIANVSYCFAADYDMPFWTTNDNGSTIGIYTIKADAEKIAAGEEETIAKYTRWMNEDHKFYVRWYDKGIAEGEAQDDDDSMVYPVRIIGINHDDKADGSGKAPLTFGFVNLLKDKHQMKTTATNNGAWRQTDLFRSMNVEGGIIYEQMPEKLRNMVLEVSKKYVYSPSQTNTNTLISKDTLFIPSFAEVYGVNDSGWYTDCVWLASEGSQYPYFSKINKGYGAAGSNPRMKQYQLTATGIPQTTPTRWWLRTVVPNGNSFVYMNDTGRDFMYYAGSNNAGGILPCFCL